MCRIVIRWIDKADVPGKSPNTKQFDPLAVLPDGTDPGSRIGYPDYMIFDLPGLPVEAADFILAPEWDVGGPVDEDGQPTKILHRTGFAMAWNRLSTPIQNQIIAAYEANQPFVIENVTEQDFLDWFDKKVA